MSRPQRPAKIAIVGAGPAGFYAAGALLDQDRCEVAVDLFDRLPTPYGLVRYGVAPDHQKIKSVIRVYEKTARDPRLRYFGNVHLGRDLTHDELAAHYDQVVYAVGAPTDRRLAIAGEDLAGSYSATEFVAWYNGHPEFAVYRYLLDRPSAAVVGAGNVALDVTRILAKTEEELRATDISDAALAQLAASRVEEIHVLARRGPAQTKFSSLELKEIGELANADVVVEPSELELDEESRRELETDRTARRNVELFLEWSARKPAGRRRRVHFHFLVSPVELVGSEGRVTSVRLERNRLERREDGGLAPRGTGETEEVAAGLVFRSIGYRGVPLAGLPFDEKRGTLPNREGRVIDPASGRPLPGVYVVGWAKRGPTGLIGSNKPDAVETVEQMVEDALGALGEAPAPPPIDDLLAARRVPFVTFGDWELLDRVERRRGEPLGRPRVKLTEVAEMLAAIAAERAKPAASADAESSS